MPLWLLRQLSDQVLLTHDLHHQHSHPRRMIGQDYIDVRARLEAALQGLGELSQDVGSGEEHGSILDNLVNSLKDPFVFVVTGEVNVGKSTLLNALFGVDLTRTGVTPTTDKIYSFRYGPEVARAEVSTTLEEVYAPIDFLKNYQVVDTPGTNSVANGHQEITERFIPMADMVIFVFSAMNPWGASAWQFLETVHRHWMRHVVFVLQQCDLRPPEEIQVILSYMKQLCQQRFEREFPIFPVSAKKAFLARSSGLDRERLLAESGFETLEKHISRSIGSGGGRIGKLKMATQIAKDILHTLQTTVAARGTSHQEKVVTLSELESGLKSFEGHTYAKLQPVVEASVADYGHASDALVEQLTKRLSPMSALTKGRKTLEELPPLMSPTMLENHTVRWEQAATIIEDDVNHVGDKLGEALREQLHVQLPDDIRPDKSFWTQRRQTFLKRVEEETRFHVTNLNLQNVLQPAVSKARKLALWSILFFLGTLGGTAYAVLQKLPPVAGAIAGGGMLLVIALWWMSRLRLKAALSKVKDHLTASQADLRKQQESHLREELHGMIEGFGKIIEPAKVSIAKQADFKHSLVTKTEQLTAEFQALDQSVRALANPGSR